MLHRLGFDYRKPEAMPRGLDDAKQQAFIDEYENLLNTMGVDEAVAFVDAVHPTHQVRPAGCWARKDVALAVEQTTGRDRLNIHGAIDLETGQTQILAVEKVNALSFIKLLGEIEGTHTWGEEGIVSDDLTTAAARAVPLSPEQLYRVCDLSRLSFATTDELEPIDAMIGQSRVLEAVEFGSRVDKAGFNLFVIGGTGVGMREAVKAMLAEDAAKRLSPPDWVYVNNFVKPDRPIAIELPSGRANGFSGRPPRAVTSTTTSTSPSPRSSSATAASNTITAVAATR